MYAEDAEFLDFEFKNNYSALSVSSAVKIFFRTGAVFHWSTCWMNTGGARPAPTNSMGGRGGLILESDLDKDSGAGRHSAEQGENT